MHGGAGLTPTTWGRKDLGVISGGKVSQPAWRRCISTAAHSLSSGAHSRFGAVFERMGLLLQREPAPDRPKDRVCVGRRCGINGDVELWRVTCTCPEAASYYEINRLVGDLEEVKIDNTISGGRGGSHISGLGDFRFWQIASGLVLFHFPACTISPSPSPLSN